MRPLYRRSTDGAILCRTCLPGADETVSAELFPNLFPGTWHQVTCCRCGYSPPPAAAVPEAAAVAVAETDSP
ncbi:hypothetical protein GCM10009099_17280 [Caenispirillum bisanense]